MEIYIVSSGRPNRQTTYHNLPKSLQDRATIVVYKHELAAYSKFPTRGIDVQGISAKRQWCVEEAKGKMIMLDDDLTFAKRRTDNPTLFEPPTYDDMYDLFDQIEDNLNEYAHVGVGTREGGNRNTSTKLYVQRMLRALAYDAPVLKNHNVRFDRMPNLMEDFDVTLHLLSRGLPNLILNHMVHNQNGSNSAGGCSQYRTPLAQEAAARKLRMFWPEHVKLVEKRTKTAWNGQPRTDVIIHWKKCYNDFNKARQ